MTGIKIMSMISILASTDSMNPLLGLPFEQITAMGLAAFCVWQMWQMIQRREKAMAAKDDQVNRLISVLENKPCTRGHLPPISHEQ